MSKSFEGVLEIDEVKGVIYFHSNETGTTMLRICSLPTPIKIPDLTECEPFLDVTHMHGASWGNVLTNTNILLT